MLKKLTLSTIVLSALLLNGCGGSSKKNTYNKISDLENKTLNMQIGV
jgi:outer membrane murein-binding lipoprotein Lpp